MENGHCIFTTVEGENKTFEEVQQEIEQIELETNERILSALKSCNVKVGIRVLDYVFNRNERERAFPIQIDAVNWDAEFPNGLPDYFLELNNHNVFGGITSDTNINVS